MHRFYDCVRKGPMAHFVSDFENAYEEATLNADLHLSPSAKSWHCLKGCSLQAYEVKNILSLVGGDVELPMKCSSQRVSLS